MKTVTVHHAKTHLSQLLREVEQGETIVVARGSHPVAQLSAYPARTRQFDTLPGLLVRMDESFDDPLDDFTGYMAAEEPQ